MNPQIYNLPIAYKNDTWLGLEFKVTTHNPDTDVSTDGVLEIGEEYLIMRYRINDDFINVGATKNKTGQLFTAIATTPDNWNKCSVLAKVSRVSLAGATIRMQIYDGATVIKTITSVSGITVTDAANGECSIDDFIPTVAGRFTYDFQVTFGSGVVITYFAGEWVVISDITQNS
jgi:hypothetical protein